MKKEIIKYAFINSLLTAAYIGLVASFLFYAPHFFNLAGKPDTVFVPMMMLMLFVFSAAITASLVLGRPMLWYLDGKKREAIQLFFSTLTVFLVITLVAFAFLVTTGA